MHSQILRKINCVTGISPHIMLVDSFVSSNFLLQLRYQRNFTMWEMKFNESCLKIVHHDSHIFRLMSKIPIKKKLGQQKLDHRRKFFVAYWLWQLPKTIISRLLNLCILIFFFNFMSLFRCVCVWSSCVWEQMGCKMWWIVGGL